MLRRMLASTAAVTAAGTLAVALTAVPARGAEFSVLVFTRTAGFRHDSIATGVATVRQLGAENDFTVEATEDPGQFTPANLARFDAVVWLSTTGDVLDEAQQAAFEGYVRAGGGYAGVHAAADTEYGWPWYGGLVGAYFRSHPHIQTATIRVEDGEHPSTAGLPSSWTREDEWYDYRTNPRPEVHVLASLDESTYAGGSMGDHPIAWCREYDGGRSWYTGLGHTAASYAEPAFRAHLLGGIRYAALGTGSCAVDEEPEPGADLALNRPATASSLESGAFPASAAVDGNPGTRWSSAFSDPQWIQVDLGATHTVDRVRLTWETAYGSAYEIRTSADGVTWTTVRTVTGGDGGVDELTGLAAPARYVRVHGTARGTVWGYSLFGLEVYGAEDFPPR